MSELECPPSPALGTGSDLGALDSDWIRPPPCLVLLAGDSKWCGSSIPMIAWGNVLCYTHVRGRFPVGSVSLKNHSWLAKYQCRDGSHEIDHPPSHALHTSKTLPPVSFLPPPSRDVLLKTMYRGPPKPQSLDHVRLLFPKPGSPSSSWKLGTALKDDRRQLCNMGACGNFVIHEVRVKSACLIWLWQQRVSQRSWENVQHSQLIPDYLRTAWISKTI